MASVSAEVRSQFDAFQPTSVLSGQELTKQLESSLGATLENQPGISVRSFGPTPSRPVIRGLDGYCVLIENGQRTDDLSSQSADHGVMGQPRLAATRVEVVRGPATLLYGANAIGGLVNVVSEIIPTTPSTKPAGAAPVRAGLGGVRGRRPSGDYAIGNGRWVFNAGGSARRSGDVSKRPLGDVGNTQARSAIGHVGAAWTAAARLWSAPATSDDDRQVRRPGRRRLGPSA